MDRRSFLKAAAAAAVAPALPAIAASPPMVVGMDLGAGDISAVTIYCGRLIIDQHAIRAFDAGGRLRVTMGTF